MCEHTRRPKQFCILEKCTLSQCYACSSCVRQLHAHSHSNEHFMTEKEMTYFLTRFDPPTTFKEERKNATLKMYKFLTRLKTEIATKLEELVMGLMGKVKYPYLYHMELLDSYRNLRDKNYQRMNPRTFRLFCKTAKNLSGIQFIDKEKEYYTGYLQESQETLRGFAESIRTVEKAFGFKLHSDVMKLHEEFMAEVDSFNKTQKSCKSSEKKEYSVPKPMSTVNGSVRLEKRAMDFLTPTKPTISHDVSLENCSFNSSGDYKSRRNSTSKENDLLSVEMTQELKRANTFDGEDKDKKSELKVGQPESKMSKSFEESKGVVSPLKMTPKLENLELHRYEDEFDSYRIKVTNSKEQKDTTKRHLEEFLNKSIDIGHKKDKEDHTRKLSYHEQVLKMSFNSRGENGMAELKKDCSVDRISLEESIRFRKETEGNSRKTVDAALKKTVAKANAINMDKNNEIFSSFSSDKKEAREAREARETREPRQHPEIMLIEAKIEAKRSNGLLYPSKRSPKKNNNVSLHKQFAHHEFEKSSQHINLPFRLGTKEIPIVETKKEPSPKKTKLQKKSSLQMTVEDELEDSCLLLLKLKELKGPDKKVEFLQKYVEKSENCISAVDYLSFLYLEQGKAKECLLLATDYLDKLEQLAVGESHKLNLLTNKSAALNLLGRYSETVALLVKYHMLESSKLHKNMGDALFNLGMVDRAIYHYEKATQGNEHYDEAYYNLAVILYMQESYFNAKMNIEKALRFQPSNTTYLELLAAISQRINRNL